MFPQKINKKFARIIKRGSAEDDDVLLWLDKTPKERLMALEEICTSYNNWKYGTEQRFQRVYTIVKRERG